MRKYEMESTSWNQRHKYCYINWLFVVILLMVMQDVPADDIILFCTQTELINSALLYNLQYVLYR